MRKATVTGVVLSAIVAVIMAVAAANADGSMTVQWQGQGADNLPCSDGGHWILTPGHNDGTITNAMLTVNNGQHISMTENGGGSWSADSVGSLDNNTTASATYTFTGSDPEPQLVLSSCTAGTSGGGGGTGGGGTGGGGTGGGSTGGGGTSGGAGAGAGTSAAASAATGATVSTAQAATAVNASPGFTG